MKSGTESDVLNIPRIDWRFPGCVSAIIALCFAIGIALRPKCDDCFRFHGWPFAYFRDAGFGYPGEFFWGGLLGDIFTAVTFGAILWVCIAMLSPSRAEASQKLLRYRTWGMIRVFYGAVLFLNTTSTAVKTLHHTVPLMPANDSEATGMAIGYILMLAGALWLMWSGFRRLRAEHLPIKKLEA